MLMVEVIVPADVVSDTGKGTLDLRLRWSPNDPLAIQLKFAPDQPDSVTWFVLTEDFLASYQGLTVRHSPGDAIFKVGSHSGYEMWLILRSQSGQASITFTKSEISDFVASVNQHAPSSIELDSAVSAELDSMFPAL